MIKRFSRGFSTMALGALVVLAGCDSSTEPILPGPPAEIQVATDAVILTSTGETAQIQVTVYDEDGNVITSPTVEWHSSNEAVVTVENGVVTAVGAGTATITVVSGTASDSIVVEVDVVPAEPSLTLSTEEYIFTEAGATFGFTATVYDEDGNIVTDPDIEWSSSNEAVATVDEEGVVTAVAEGSATITATSGEASGSAEITVSLEDPPAGPSVTVIPETLVLASIGATQSLSTIVHDEDGNVVTEAEIEWSSSNEAVATVDGDGVVTAVAEGSATITATSGEASGTSEVTVEMSGPAVILSPTSLLLSSIGATGTLAATVYDVGGLVVIDAEIDWASSNEAVATVDEDGVVTAVAEGSATITATSGAVSGATEVTVEISGGTEGSNEP